MPNIGAVINAHNKKILEEKPSLARGKCNCNNKNECPLNGECMTTNVLYETEINSNLPNYSNKMHKGITGPNFKLRYGNHKKSWKIKNKGGDYNIKWNIIKQCPTYNPSNKKCALCLNEELEILDHKKDNLLNKRLEIFSTCRHKAKFMLKYVTSQQIFFSYKVRSIFEG